MASFSNFNYGLGIGTAADNWQIARAYSASGSFVVPTDGVLWVVAIGAGGSGGSGFDNTNANNCSGAGGGAGGLCIKKILALKGDTYTITVGAGGAVRTRTSNGSTAGAAGGNTTIIGPGINLFAGGGGGGGAATVANGGAGSSLTATGGAGGVAVGGDANNVGMDGGSITITSGTPNASSVSTGGGAVNLNDIRYTANYSGAAGLGLAISGGGSGTGAVGATGSTGVGTTYPDGGNSANSGFGLATPYTFFGIEVDGIGGTSNTVPATSGGGGYGTALYATSNNLTATGGTGGIFGGGGSASIFSRTVDTGISGSTATAGAGGIGGGGAGAAAYSPNGGGASNSGAGGSGLVLVFWGII